MSVSFETNDIYRFIISKPHIIIVEIATDYTFCIKIKFNLRMTNVTQLIYNGKREDVQLNADN